MDFYLRQRLWWKVGCVVLGVVLVFLLLYLFTFKAPGDFPRGQAVAVKNGRGLSEIAYELKQKKIIRSTFLFTNFIILFKHERAVVGGEYYFDRPMSVYAVAKRLANGTFNMEQAKTTIPEGSTIFDINNYIKKNYPDFDSITFLKIAQSKEGYLFPDTYKFGASVNPERIVSVMTATFDRRVGDTKIKEAIDAFGKPLDEVVTMASILEGEGRLMQTRRMIAGILWERIRRGIPLQVDAAFRYINGKTSADLTLADLKIDSPYNTYIHTGFTPTPISNPGIDAILAAVTPIKSEYLYFLTDAKGVMHYARTLEEHKANKERYLP